MTPEITSCPPQFSHGPVPPVRRKRLTSPSLWTAGGIRSFSLCGVGLAHGSVAEAEEGVDAKQEISFGPNGTRLAGRW